MTEEQQNLTKICFTFFMIAVVIVLGVAGWASYTTTVESNMLEQCIAKHKPETCVCLIKPCKGSTKTTHVAGGH